MHARGTGSTPGVMLVGQEAEIVDAPLEALPQILDALGSQRILVISGPSQRFVERLVRALSDRTLQLFSEARRHVPVELVKRAREAAEQCRADTVITLGGGSATGLGKVLKLEHALKFIAVPTTYSGSEYTTLYGITESGRKRTARAAQVKPDVVLRDVTLTQSMPLDLSVSSLLNAMAHPIARLASKELAAVERDGAYLAIGRLLRAIELLLLEPTSPRARQLAFSASCLAAQAIEAGVLSEHHSLVHALGGSLDLEHGSLHAILLPHSVRALRSNSAPSIVELPRALDILDFEGALYDFLLRAKCPTSLRALGLDLEQLMSLLEGQEAAARQIVRDAFHGRRPSSATRREDLGARELVSIKGPPPTAARRVVLCIHGRGSNADAILRRAEQITGNDPELALVAPQAPRNSWYERRHHESREELGEAFNQSIQDLERIAQHLLQSVEASRLVLFGFSQGACLALELFVALGQRLGAVVALSGARIGEPSEAPEPPSALAGTPVLLGTSVGDPWLTSEQVERAARQFATVGCSVSLELLPGDQHGLHAVQRIAAKPLLRGVVEPDLRGGFAAFHESEALPGALPRHQNSPWPTPLGLVAEQVNATGFTAPRAKNRRSWLYRMRPSAQQRALSPLEHPTLVSDFETRAPEVNLVGFGPLALPVQATDFVDGLVTLGGAGSPAMHRGFAVHCYVANRSMEERAFSCADGDLLLVPELGRLVVLTELGVLKLAPGSVATLPRGMRFSVLLIERAARGYVAEIFGSGFELPERGPVGANGLAEARHFRVPNAWHEDRLSPGFRLAVKFGGRLYQATQDYSPFDVVAWHGNYAPYVYDLLDFSPVANVRFDHVDPSVYTVLSAPLDDTGSNNLDFVVFVPRWDPTEHTFRLPYFHRNATTEFNGIIRQRGHAIFEPGCCFLTPGMTPHGVVASSLPPATRAAESAPGSPQQDSLWFQFETTLPFSLTSWAESAQNRIADLRTVWGGYGSQFRIDP